jgi:hypothetical protein
MTKNSCNRCSFRIRPERVSGRRRFDRSQVLLLLVLVGSVIFAPCWSFQHRTLLSLHRIADRKQIAPLSIFQTIGDESNTVVSEIEPPNNNNKNNDKDDDDQPKKAFWKPKGKNTRWQERIHLDELQVGQELYGHVIQELLEGKTGPKLFFDCGKD